jgi:hypothetical protein
VSGSTSVVLGSVIAVIDVVCECGSCWCDCSDKGLYVAIAVGWQVVVYVVAVGGVITMVYRCCV